MIMSYNIVLYGWNDLKTLKNTPYNVMRKCYNVNKVKVVKMKVTKTASGMGISMVTKKCALRFVLESNGINE